MRKDIYESPLSSRYASEYMLHLFSPDMRFQTWRRLWVALARAEHEYKVDRIHRLFGLDKKLVDKYMRMGYASHQVKRAMFLARHCDKSVEELLAMKTRQQKWGDICEQLGLPRDACMK